MTATNHVITGALIAASVKNPYIALPLALISHFVLDTIPHFGTKRRDFRFILIISSDMAIASSVLLSILLLQLNNWPLLIASGVIAASPDLLWLYYLIYDLKGIPKEKSKFARLASKIQWSESNWGLITEAIWFMFGMMLLFRIST